MPGLRVPAEQKIAEKRAQIEPPAALEGELRVDDEAARHLPGRVEVARRARVAHGVGQHLRAEGDFAADRSRVRVEQQLRRVAVQAARGVVGAGDPVPIGLAGAGSGQAGAAAAFALQPNGSLNSSLQNDQQRGWGCPAAAGRPAARTNETATIVNATNFDMVLLQGGT